ncbi:MAG: hypothetical protein HY726_21630 [Candidatus Rokubacteria bacterium]|nr:hypothetical protein [Candidatus Rokubacteria bacterium]
MGPLVAIGGLFVPGENLRELEAAIQAVCVEAGFPRDEEFKWSPPRGSWMHQDLVADSRRDFFTQVLSLARDSGCTSAVVVEDTSCGRATGAPTPEFDVTQMFLERATWALAQEDGVVVVDRPGGGHRGEETFLSQCFVDCRGCKDVLGGVEGYLLASPMKRINTRYAVTATGRSRRGE